MLNAINAVIKRIASDVEAFSKTCPASQAGSCTVTISGLSEKAREVLMERPVVARYFPFAIGRSSGSDSSFRFSQDLSITDQEPYRLSKNHLRLVWEEDRIFAVDMKSRTGSLVNGKQLGRKFGGKGEDRSQAGLQRGGFRKPKLVLPFCHGHG